MRKLSVRTKIMVIGFVLGLLVTVLMFQLVLQKGLDISGVLILLLLSAVVFVFGFRIGKEVKIKSEYDRAWEDGYREGRIEGALKFGLNHPNCRCSPTVNTPER